jgi:hypothetical protein
VTAEPCDESAASAAESQHSELGGVHLFSGDGVRGLLDKLHHTDHADRDVRDDDPDDADVRIQRVLSQSESPERRHKEKDSEKTELKRLLLFATGAKLEAEARQKELRQLVEALRLRADAAGTPTRFARPSCNPPITRAKHSASVCNTLCTTRACPRAVRWSGVCTQMGCGIAASARGPRRFASHMCW